MNVSDNKDSSEHVHVDAENISEPSVAKHMEGIEGEHQECYVKELGCVVVVAAPLWPVVGVPRQRAMLSEPPAPLPHPCPTPLA